MFSLRYPGTGYLALGTLFFLVLTDNFLKTKSNHNTTAQSFESLARSQDGSLLTALFDSPFNHFSRAQISLNRIFTDSSSVQNNGCRANSSFKSSNKVTTSETSLDFWGFLGVHWIVSAQSSSFCQNVGCWGSFAVGDVQDCPAACDSTYRWYYSDPNHSSPDLGWKTDGSEVCTVCRYCREVRCSIGTP